MGKKKKLQQPISVDEVKSAAKTLKNGKAVGPDKIANEWLKHADLSFYQRYADAINTAFELNKYPKIIGEAILTPLAKPGKPAGPLSSLRPLTLSNGARKMLSMVTLKRIEEKVDIYTGHTQAAYKRGRSCADLVFAQRMLVSVVVRQKFQFHKMGVDMSRAFDTIKRKTILYQLIAAGCNDDEVRLVRLLLSNTVLKVKVGDILSKPFESYIGAFQGDCLSGKLFTLVLAGALYDLRGILETLNPPVPNPPISAEGMPLESGYADDLDFFSTERETLEAIFHVAKDTFKDWNLFINELKTEYTHVYVAPKGQKVPGRADIKLQENEEWTKHKILGSLLCSQADIRARCIAGNIAFMKFKAIWDQQNININRKLAVYEAQVVSVILYNSGSWSPTKSSLNHLDICHRKHLRSILNIKWPQGFINNVTLYRRCDTEPLSVRVHRSRWKLLGHILRSPTETPASSALKFSVTSSDDYVGRVGRPRNNLFNYIRDDLKKRGLNLTTLDDLNNLKTMANDRPLWRRFCNKNL